LLTSPLCLQPVAHLGEGRPNMPLCLVFSAPIAQLNHSLEVFILKAPAAVVKVPPVAHLVAVWPQSALVSGTMTHSAPIAQLNHSLKVLK
jgi:hypothetical protein